MADDYVGITEAGSDLKKVSVRANNENKYYWTIYCFQDEVDRLYKIHSAGHRAVMTFTDKNGDYTSIANHDVLYLEARDADEYERQEYADQ